MDYILRKNEFFEKTITLQRLWSPAKLSDKVWAEKNSHMHPWAMGWYVNNRKENPNIVSAGGGQSALVTYLDDDLSIIILTNLAGANPANFIDEIAEYYLSDFGLTSKIKFLKIELDSIGYNNAFQTYKKIEKSKGFKFNAKEIHDLASMLKKYQREEAAVEIFKLNNRLFSSISVRTKELNSFVGRYQLDGFSIDVTSEAGALFIQATGESILPIFAESKNKFVLKIVDASISFHKGIEGTINRLVLHQGDQALVGKKVK